MQIFRIKYLGFKDKYECNSTDRPIGRAVSFLSYDQCPIMSCVLLVHLSRLAKCLAHHRIRKCHTKIHSVGKRRKLLLFHVLSHREVYHQEFQPSYDIFRRFSAKGCSDHRFRARNPSLHCPIANSASTQRQQSGTLIESSQL